jgi:hypothetical protein
MHVDEARRDDRAANVDLTLGRDPLHTGADQDHATVSDCDIGNAVVIVRRIDDPTAPQQQIRALWHRIIRGSTHVDSPCFGAGLRQTRVEPP